jgi:hypothetical protein
MSGRRASLLAWLMLLLSACKPSPSEQAVSRLLRCEECNRGELQAVLDFGNQAVDHLDRVLSKGPSARERAIIRQQAADRYARLHPAGVSLADWVRHYDTDFVISFQKQAGYALGLIPTAEAREALHKAMRNDSLYDRDVIRTLTRAAPIAVSVAAGNGQGAPSDSLVRVDPTVRVSDSITGQPLANMRVVFTVDSGGGLMPDPGAAPDSVVLRRTNVNGLASVRWSLGVVPDSFNVLRANVLGKSASFNATAHGPTPRLVFTMQPVNGLPGQPLSPGIEAMVVDAWDQRDTTFNGPAQVAIIGTAIAAAAPIVKGVVSFTGLVPPVLGTGLRLRVQAAGATSAVSQPFTIAP